MAGAVLGRVRVEFPRLHEMRDRHQEQGWDGVS
jgi:hypothetical protein